MNDWAQKQEKISEEQVKKYEKTKNNNNKENKEKEENENEEENDFNYNEEFDISKYNVISLDNIKNNEDDNNNIIDEKKEENNKENNTFRTVRKNYNKKTKEVKGKHKKEKYFETNH